MADWQQGFVRRLNGLREGWNRAFARAMDEDVAPAFEELESFLTTNGFTLTKPRSDGGVRAFKFALGEDAYVLVTFKLRGPLEVEVSDEVFVAGHEQQGARKESVPLQSIDAGWAQRQFQSGLDRLIAVLESTSAELVAECV